MVTGQETCPFAPPGEQNQPLFASSLFKNQTAHFDYQTTCYRRGLYTFSKIPLRSSGPFSLFSTRRTITVPTEILIYPAFHPLNVVRERLHRGLKQTFDPNGIRARVLRAVCVRRRYRVRGRRTRGPPASRGVSLSERCAARLSGSRAGDGGRRGCRRLRQLRE